MPCNETDFYRRMTDGTLTAYRNHRDADAAIFRRRGDAGMADAADRDAALADAELRRRRKRQNEEEDADAK